MPLPSRSLLPSLCAGNRGAVSASESYHIMSTGDRKPPDAILVTPLLPGQPGTIMAPFPSASVAATTRPAGPLLAPSPDRLGRSYSSGASRSGGKPRRTVDAGLGVTGPFRRSVLKLHQEAIHL